MRLSITPRLRGLPVGMSELIKCPIHGNQGKRKKQGSVPRTLPAHTATNTLAIAVSVDTIGMAHNLAVAVAVCLDSSESGGEDEEDGRELHGDLVCHCGRDMA